MARSARRSSSTESVTSSFASGSRIRPGAALAAALAAAALAAGCGLGAGRAPSAIQLTVSGEFGARVLRSWNAPRVSGQETVMSLLMRNASVSTRYGGGFVHSIDGLAGGETAGQRLDWFYYVNGVEASQGAAATNVHPGDHIWWDRHDWSQTDSVPAVVGSFPEPFLNGLAGKRLPVRVECASVGDRPCRTVAARLRALSIPAAIAAIGPGEEPDALRVLVGPWRAVRAVGPVQAIEQGPRASGVYARFVAGADALTLLDARAGTMRTLGAGAGLVAATRFGEQAPIWVVTGTDRAGVAAAAAAFDQRDLHDRFALALAPGGGAVALPVARGVASGVRGAP